MSAYSLFNVQEPPISRDSIDNGVFTHEFYINRQVHRLPYSILQLTSLPTACSLHPSSFQASRNHRSISFTAWFFPISDILTSGCLLSLYQIRKSISAIMADPQSASFFCRLCLILLLYSKLREVRQIIFSPAPRPRSIAHQSARTCPS